MKDAAAVQPYYIAYKFRAECEADAHIFLSAIRWDLLEVEITHAGFANHQGFNIAYPDCDVNIKLTGNLSLDNLRWVADQIDDCHVIADTIKRAVDYDGVRLYGEYETARPSLEDLSKISEGLNAHIDYLEAQTEIVSSALGRLRINTQCHENFVSTELLGGVS